MLGFLTVGFGLFAILLAFSKAEDWGWSSYSVLILITAGLISLALFVVIELEVEHPLLDVRVFRYWPFTNSLLLLSILQVGLMGVLFYVPVFLQQGQGLTAFEAGLRILPQALVVGVLMPVAGKLYDKIGPRWLAVVGLGISAYGTYLLCGITPDMTHGDVVLWTCVRAVGMGLAMMPIMTAGIAGLPPAKVNEGSALNNVARQVSGALGLAVLASIASMQQAQRSADRGALLTQARMAEVPVLGPPDGQNLTGLYALYRQTQLAVLASSYSDIFLLTAAFTLVGAVIALLMRSGPPAAASPPPAPAPSTPSSPSSRDGPARAEEPSDAAVARSDELVGLSH
jgi:EmrB/QacA subfamily drug resistance transporter